jgi:hypothetical protein
MGRTSIGGLAQPRSVAATVNIGNLRKASPPKKRLTWRAAILRVTTTFLVANLVRD